MTEYRVSINPQTASILGRRSSLLVHACQLPGFVMKIQPNIPLHTFRDSSFYFLLLHYNARNTILGQTYNRTRECTADGYWQAILLWSCLVPPQTIGSTPALRSIVQIIYRAGRHEDLMLPGMLSDEREVGKRERKERATPSDN